MVVAFARVFGFFTEHDKIRRLEASSLPYT